MPRLMLADIEAAQFDAGKSSPTTKGGRLLHANKGPQPTSFIPAYNGTLASAIIVFAWYGWQLDKSVKELAFKNGWMTDYSIHS